MSTHRSIQILCLLGVVLLFVPGCTKHIGLTSRGHAIVQSEPADGAVHPYPGPTAQRDGPFVAVYLSTNADLETLAQTWTDHLYFELLPCSQESHGYALFSGRVFRATDNERSKVEQLNDVPDNHMYKVHLPTDLERITKAAQVYGALDVLNYLETARRSGLCIRVGGAKMWGSSLFSNSVAAPLVLRGEALIVVEPPQS